MRKAVSRRRGQFDKGTPEVGRSKRQTQHNVPKRPLVGFRQRFEFIEGLNSKADRKKTRSWVTTEHYRRKQYEERHVEQDTDPESKGKGRGHLTSPSGSSTSDNDRPRLVEDESQARAEQVVTLNPSTDESLFLQRLGASRADPFNSYPIPATRDVHELVDHFYFVIPSLIHRYWQRATRRPRACWDLFNLYRQHEIPFLGMLHHAAHHLAGMREQSVSLQVIEFKQRSLAAVNQSLQNIQGHCDDWTIVGVGLLANAERVWGDREIARMHWGALKWLLLERGGFPALQHNPPMHTKLVWSFIALSWPTADGNPAYVDGFTESAAATTGSPKANPNAAFRRSCEEFVQFINVRRSQAFKNLPSTPAQQREFKSLHRRTTMFQEGSDLDNALRAIDTGYASLDKRRALKNCRMACLIHLSLVMTEFGDFSQGTEEYLHALQRILQQGDDDTSLSAEHLLWTLLTAFKPQGHYERIWKMTRLIGVVKRTRAHTWTAIENVLRTFFRLPDSVEHLEAGMSGWNREGFLEEVLRPDKSGPSGTAAVFHGQHGADVPCSESCQICALKPATF